MDGADNVPLGLVRAVSRRVSDLMNVLMDVNHVERLACAVKVADPA